MIPKGIFSQERGDPPKFVCIPTPCHVAELPQGRERRGSLATCNAGRIIAGYDLAFARPHALAKNSSPPPVLHRVRD